MNIVKGIYHNGIIEPLEKTKSKDPSEVIIIFPETGKGIKKIGGLFKDYVIDYDQIEKDLNKLGSDSEKHINKELYE